MGLVLLLAFIGVPIIEIAIFIQVGGWIGLWPTLGLVVLTAIVGSMELRSQGLATLNKLRAQVDRGELPTQTLFDGVCLLFAGALLLTPGFFTDIVGLLLFVGAFRRFLLQVIGPYVAKHAEARVYAARSGGAAGPQGRRGRPDDGVIDADYVDITEDDDPEDPNRRLRP